MQTIDTPALIQRVQEARARLGVTIRECAEKIGHPPYSTKIRPEDWARFERGETPAHPEFAAKVAAMLGIEVPLTNASEPAPEAKSYRCAELSEDDQAELQRLATQVKDFCKAKGVGLLQITTCNMTRSLIDGGLAEESLSNLQSLNLHALPLPIAPLAHMLVSIAKEPPAADLKESLQKLAGFTVALQAQTKESLELAPAGDAILEGFHESQPRFRA
jgi:transcriptional regulator with XRE-family HTH domain